MTRLSVNVNKVATLRNSRGGGVPSVLEAVDACLRAGARGITVHPRADERHVTPRDVREIADQLAPHRSGASHAPGIEYNIEGDPRPGWLELVHEVRPDQATLVPVRPGEVTSEAGWGPDTPVGPLRETVQALRTHGIRVSVFVEADVAPIEWAAKLGADRIELYTEPYARAFAEGGSAAEASFRRFAAAAEAAHELGLGVNAGHDLDLVNLPRFRALPHLAEVSIGHALISRALFVGLERVVREYLQVLAD